MFFFTFNNKKPLQNIDSHNVDSHENRYRNKLKLESAMVLKQWSYERIKTMKIKNNLAPRSKATCPLLNTTH